MMLDLDGEAYAAVSMIGTLGVFGPLIVALGLLYGETGAAMGFIGLSAFWAALLICGLVQRARTQRRN